MSAAIKSEGGFFGSKARFLIFIQVQYVITHEQERLKGQIFKHLTVQLLPNLYTHSFYSELTNLATMHSTGAALKF